MSKTGLRPIDIDFDVYQLIVLEKRGFDEPDNDALRRLLGLNGRPARTMATAQGEKGRLWSYRNGKVELPDGTELKMAHSGIEYTGRVTKGRWKVEGIEYDSPSAAAIGVVYRRTGRKISVNGWKYWHVKRQSDKDWIPLDKLRNLYEP
ncbi:MAG: hypothetical protein OXD44_02085 [Gammaproteobacteria bacterium]|nr:hypothetical protein [Gammaproteobacteria bacterium]